MPSPRSYATDSNGKNDDNTLNVRKSEGGGGKEGLNGGSRSSFSHVLGQVDGGD